MKIRGLRWWIRVVLVVIAGTAGGWWYGYSSPRELTVSIFPDFIFRQRAGWKALLESRMAEVSRIYETQTGVRWRIASINTGDPINVSTGTLDARRSALERNRTYPADVLLIVTGQREGTRTGSVSPFSHAALVVDFPDGSELRNILTLAHELANLFGAPNEPGANTLMAPEPNDERFSARAAKLIHRLRRYPFAEGAGGLLGSWEGRALSALAEANAGLFPNALSRAHQAIAAALAVDARYTPAIQHMREAVKLEPNSPAPRMDLAFMLLQDTQPDAAIAVLRDGIRVNPNDSRLHGMLASALFGRDREEALDEYREAIRLEPNNADFHAALGEVLVLGMGRVDGAIAAFQEALRLDRENERAREGLAKAQQLKEQALEDAADLSQQASAAKTDDKIYYSLGVAEARAGNFDAATRALAKAMDLNPRSPQPHSVMAVMHYVRGDYAAASAELDKAKALGTPPRRDFLAALQRKTSSR